MSTRLSYKCWMCKGEFESTRPEGEAVAEASTNFPGYTPSDDDLVCDDCYNVVMEGDDDA